MRFSLTEATGSDADLETIVAIVNATSPEEPASVEELRWQDTTYPGGKRFLAWADGRPVGAGTVGRIFIYPPEFDGLWATVTVVPAARRQGMGSAILAAVSVVAREAGKSALHVPASEARPDGIAFLAHRGFTEYDRSKAVELQLAGMSPPAVEPPPGIVITTLAERPDLVAGVHAVAIEAFADIPGGGEPPVAGTLAEFRAREVDRPQIPHDAFMLALDAESGTVVGYASLLLLPDPVIRRAGHDMTAVARAWRGRGVARALKLATIGWAVERGLAVLETGNDTDNAPMRAVNARLGYRPLPDLLTMRGPVAGRIMDVP
jgi:GNAT superfamily N-acetyltransferase